MYQYRTRHLATLTFVTRSYVAPFFVVLCATHTHHFDTTTTDNRDLQHRVPIEPSDSKPSSSTWAGKTKRKRVYVDYVWTYMARSGTAVGHSRDSPQKTDMILTLLAEKATLLNGHEFITNNSMPSHPPCPLTKKRLIPVDNVQTQ